MHIHHLQTDEEEMHEEELHEELHEEELHEEELLMCTSLLERCARKLCEEHNYR